MSAPQVHGFRSRFASLAPTQRIAALIWALLIVGVTIRVAIAKNNSSSVFPVYRTAAASWADGTDLYTLDFSKPCFRYHPLVAVAFVPLNLLPEKLAAILWRWIGVALLLAGMACWQRQFLPKALSANAVGAFFLLAAPLALQSLNNGQANLHLMGLILFAIVAADRKRWMLCALLMTAVTILKLYPIAIGLLLIVAFPRSFAWRYALALLVAFMLPFLFQHPLYVAGQYRLWLDYLFVDARHTGSIEQAPRDLFLLVRFWFDSPPQWLYRLVQLGSGAGIAWVCLSIRNRAGSETEPVLSAILHFGCLWMTMLGPSTESSTYTLLGPTAATILILSAFRHSRAVFCLSAVGYFLLVIPTIAAAFPGGTRLQHFGPQPAGAFFLFAAVMCFRFSTPNSEFRTPNFQSAPCCPASQFA